MDKPEPWRRVPEARTENVEVRHLDDPDGGRCAQLLVDGFAIMTDTVTIWRTYADVVARAHHAVLLAGLGVGMLPAALAQKGDVSRILVLENNRDVIGLVGPSFPEIEIVEADARTFEPRGDWDSIILDIWSGMTSRADRDELAALRQRFRPYLHNDRSVILSCWDGAI